MNTSRQSQRHSLSRLRFTGAAPIEWCGSPISLASRESPSSFVGLCSHFSRHWPRALVVHEGPREVILGARTMSSKKSRSGRRNPKISAQLSLKKGLAEKNLYLHRDFRDKLVWGFDDIYLSSGSSSSCRDQERQRQICLT